MALRNPAPVSEALTRHMAQLEAKVSAIESSTLSAGEHHGCSKTPTSVTCHSWPGAFAVHAAGRCESRHLGILHQVAHQTQSFDVMKRVATEGSIYSDGASRMTRRQGMGICLLGSVDA